MDPSSASTSFNPSSQVTAYQQMFNACQVLDHCAVPKPPSSSWNSSPEKKSKSQIDVLEFDGGIKSCQAGTSSATYLNSKPKNHGKDIMDDEALVYHVDANGSPLGDSDDASDDDFEYYLEEDSDCEYNFAKENCNHSELSSSVASTQLDYVHAISPGVEEDVPGWKNSMLNNKTYHYNEFKQFDIISDDLSDHFFINAGLCDALSIPKNLAKRIHYEWKVLEEHLPETIFVIGSEKRIDLLRAVIVGPSGTPYHDGLFFFDILFPKDYPNFPPKVNFHAGGERLNPNLYNCGKVCLSLLNTWPGNGCENWKPDVSTILQVLVSIQALILNTKPYFNEPGFEGSIGNPKHESQALAYNQNAFLLSCKAMVSQMWTPPKPQCLKEFVNVHYRVRGHDILAACVAYINGVEVGCYDGKENEELDLHTQPQNPSMFIKKLRDVFEQLLMGFSVKGAECAKFFAMKLKKPSESNVCVLSLLNNDHSKN